MADKKPAKTTVRIMAPMMDKDFRAEDDMRTLARAEEIKSDKSRHEAAKKAAQEQMKQVSAILEQKPAEKKSSKKDDSMERFVERREKADEAKRR